MRRLGLLVSATALGLVSLQAFADPPDLSGVWFISAHVGAVETTDGVYFVPALTGLGAPHWEPDARGTIVGLTRGTTRAHLVRAALEAMAYSTGDVLEAMRAGGTIDRLRVDGGATANDWLMQFQADLLNLPVERPDLVETTAAGAACLAGLAAGVWATPDAFLAGRRFATFVPGAGRPAAQAGAAGWSRAVQTTLYWARIFKDA